MIFLYNAWPCLLIGISFFTGFKGTSAASHVRTSNDEDAITREALRLLSQAERITTSLQERNALQKTNQEYLMNMLASNDMSMPTKSPTRTKRPTRNPNPAPTTRPTRRPRPTSRPTRVIPIDPPTPNPTEEPSTMTPDTFAPTEGTSMPTASPSSAPTPSPTTLTPTTIQPTPSPTGMPSIQPTVRCNVSPEVRELLIRVILNSVSEPSLIGTPGTPQNRAYTWLVDLDTRYLCPDDPDLVQRYVMAVFYYSTNGNRWDECSAPSDFSSAESIATANLNCNIPNAAAWAWLTPSNECIWGGVECKPVGDGSVVKIDFEANGLGGTLASELVQLESLEHLSLENGVIGGSIPPEFGDLKNLTLLDLNFNVIQGPIPDELFTLDKLEQLDLNGNGLTGSISSEIGALTNLNFFQVHDNNLQGTIPSEIGQLQLLRTASFEMNNFSNPMPQTICALRNLTLSDLSADCLILSGRQSPPYVQCARPQCCTSCS